MSRLPAIAMVVTAVTWAGFAIWLGSHPDSLLKAFGIESSTPQMRTEIRAFYGGVELGIAALIAVAVLSALVPYSIGLHFNDYRQFSYSGWQITNWAWTLFEITQGRNLDREVIVIVFSASVAFLACILASPQLVFPRRTATPLRVQEERAKSNA